MKIQQFTHGDLDGVACALVARYLFSDAEQKVVHCQYGTRSNSIDVNVMKFLDNEPEADMLLITDICPSPAVCERIEAMKASFERVVVQDHHNTTAWAAKYAWMEHEAKNKRCGAEMLLDWGGASDNVVRGFVDAVDAYDRWQLDSPYRARGEDLNLLYKFLGFSGFMKEFSANPAFQADRTGWTHQLLPTLKNRVNRIVQAEVKNLAVHTDKQKRKYAFLALSSSHASETGDAILKQRSDVDYVVMAMPGIDTITMRSRASGVNVSEIADANGGGGHAGAAGFKMPLGEILWNATAGCLDG